VFETLRVYGGVPFMLDAHLTRFAASAALVGLQAPDTEAFAGAAAEAIAAAGEPDATLRLLWTPGSEDGHAPVGLVLVSTLPPDLDGLRARGLRLAVVQWMPSALATAKSTSYAANLAARDDALRRDADDALLVDPSGVALEAPTSNVWFREGARLLTPALTLPLLAGVTRAALMSVAPEAGYEVEEGTFPLERVLRADEVILTSSVREVMPVVSIDGAPVASGQPGEAAAALQAALRSAVAPGYPLRG
jgi:branched-subunit amino acid aminotransferase/4-amino-4-deoxychorismate lyase